MTLDQQRFHLEKTKTLAQLRIDLANARADVALKWLQASEKRVKIENDVAKLKHLKKCMKEYHRELYRYKRDVVTVEKESERLENATKYAVKLLWGEYLPADLVNKCWASFRKLFVFTPDMELTRVNRPAASEFSHNRFPSKVCEDPPKTTYLLAIFEWCRKKNYVPRIGTVPYHSLQNVLIGIEEASERQGAVLSSQLNHSLEQLRTLQGTAWRTLDIADFTGKLS